LHGVLTLFTLAAIGEKGYVVCVPVLLSVCILLLTPKIPWRIKLVAAAVELAACALLYWTIGMIKVQFRHGLLG
jgi:hypothetical protein